MKKAYLVEFIITTRIIAEECELDEESKINLIAQATDKFKKQATPLIEEANSVMVTEDQDCPYDEEFDKDVPELPITTPIKSNMQHFIKYRKSKYACRPIKYYEKAEGIDFETSSLVSTNTLNDILRSEIHSEVDEVSDEAQTIDNLIAFFLPGGEIVNTSPEFVLKCLNNTFRDYIFTYCE